MSEELMDVAVEEKVEDPGRIIFSDDVVATIAALAVQEVDGVAGMAGSSGSLWNKKSATKGVKVQVGTEDVSVDLSVIVSYGYRIQDVCQNIQYNVSNGIETMTGLKCQCVNVFVQGISFARANEEDEKAAVEPECIEASEEILEAENDCAEDTDE